MQRRVSAQAVKTEPTHILEHCKNPSNQKCKNTDIELYIVYKGVQHPICSCCWNTLAEKPFDWEEPSSTQALRKARNGMKNHYLRSSRGARPAINGINTICHASKRPTLPTKQAQSKNKENFRPILNQTSTPNDDPF